jgi:hypothetical protein
VNGAVTGSKSLYARRWDGRLSMYSTGLFWLAVGRGGLLYAVDGCESGIVAGRVCPVLDEVDIGQVLPLPGLLTLVSSDCKQKTVSLNHY